MYEKLKISHHEHSLRLRPHEHTSYLPLLLLVVIVGIVLALFTISAYASPGPQSGSIGLNGSVPAAPPKDSATISIPTDGQHFTTSPITVSGTCPTGTLVEIYKNDIFAGSTPCDDGGKYSLKIDLLFGQNSLIARVYDVLNQAGPPSKAITVFYDGSFAQAAPSSFLNLTGEQLIINTDAAYRGIFPNQTLNVPLTIIGGTAPFAVNVQWGDLSNKVIPRSDNSTFNASHAFKRPGVYQMNIQVTDSKQLVAFLTVAAFVNGQPGINATTISSSKPSTNKLLLLWPVYAIIITLVTSFWLGERREKRILTTAARIQNTPLGITPRTTA